MAPVTPGWRVLRPIADAAEVPWANGAGTTRELVGWDESRTLIPGTRPWRLSIARLERTGGFSALHGIDRTFLLTGADATLSVDGTRRALRDGDVLRFSGDQAVALVELGAPCHAVNLMVERSDAGTAPQMRTGIPGPAVRLAVALGSTAGVARFDLLERAGDADAPLPVAMASLTLI